MYDIRGKLVHNFLVIDFTTQGNIVECFFWGNGVVAMTSDMQIFVAEVQCGISSALHIYNFFLGYYWSLPFTLMFLSKGDCAHGRYNCSSQVQAADWIDL